MKGKVKRQDWEARSPMALEKVHYMHFVIFEWQPYGTEAAEL